MNGQLLFMNLKMRNVGTGSRYWAAIKFIKTSLRSFAGGEADIFSVNPLQSIDEAVIRESDEALTRRNAGFIDFIQEHGWTGANCG
jgi:hypothetical protein